MRVTSVLLGKFLHITVANTGKLRTKHHRLEKNESSGTGLENLKERLAYLDPQSQFSLHEDEGQVFAQLFLSVKPLNHEDLESTDR